MTRPPKQDFTVGEIISLITGLPLYGDKTFARSKLLGEFRTGLPLGLEAEPDVHSDEFVTLTGWRLAVIEADQGQMWMQMMTQYVNAMLLNAIVITFPEREDDIPALVHNFRDEAMRSGVDLERRIQLAALSHADMTQSMRRMRGTEDYQRHCVQAMLQQAAQG